MQKQKPDPVTGELQFKSSVDCAMQTLRAGGSDPKALRTSKRNLTWGFTSTLK